jgi:LmbE family N-acetylglucosaminyl deacetylase
MTDNSQPPAPTQTSNYQTNLIPFPDTRCLASYRPKAISFPRPMRYSWTLLLLSAAALVAAAQPYATDLRPASVHQEIAINRGSAALWQSLKKLHTRASLLMVTAHPDDEDGGMLTYESRGRGTRVALLTLNRGEGGANEMSPDFFDALGLVRTMELLQAGRYYGVDQYWTRVIDYGFSKTRAESIARWTHDRVLADVVRIVRTTRPLVITSVFTGSPSDGHGNHETAGAMAQEVFRAAADPTQFPDQIQAGLRPWAPLKVYARARGASAGTVHVEIPQGDYDPVLGASYLQIAREGLGLQKTQNGGPVLPRTGALASAYHRYASLVPAQDREAAFFDGIDVTLMGIAALARDGDTAFLRTALAEINAAVETAIAEFSAPHPERSAPTLSAGLKATLHLIDALDRSSLSAGAKLDVRHELEIKRAQFNHALAEALGLSLSATVAPPGQLSDPESARIAIPGQTFPVRVSIVSQSAVRLNRIAVEPYRQRRPWTVAGAPAAAVDLIANRPVDAHFTVTVPQDTDYTRPYFARPDIEQPYYDIADSRFLGESLSADPLSAWADFTFDGAPIRLGRHVQTMRRVNGLGSVYEPLVVGPAIAVRISPHAGVAPIDARSFPVTAVLHSNVKGPAAGSIRLEAPAGWRVEPPIAPFATAADGEDQSVTFTVTPSNLSEQLYEIKAVAEWQGRAYREGYTVSGYPGVRPYFLYRPASYITRGVDVKVAPNLKVGYIMGTGDEVPASLEHLGIKVAFLGPADIAGGDLSKYDVLLLGVRTYAAREDLRTHNPRILDYVRNGGVVIVQYNTPEFDRNYGPYPYSMGPNPEEVTNETSKVTILDPAHPVFNWPNRITEKDFDGWVEERGSKWMRTWDPQYVPLLEAHDEDQEPQRGGLLYAKYGKGIYIYNAWAFYRQLPEGVPGAYRLFANLLSLGAAGRRDLR